MTYQEFVAGPAAQQRYWARSHLGWRRMGRAVPNDGHRALAAARRRSCCITQNVDGLHEAAGHAPLVALHGRVADVVCLSCRRRRRRGPGLQAAAGRAQPGLAGAATSEVVTQPRRRRGARRDARASSCRRARRAAACSSPTWCSSARTSRPTRVARCYDAVDALGADGALLVAGSSLTVMSGLRFVKRAARAGMPVVIVNRGATRGDDAGVVQARGGDAASSCGRLAGVAGPDRRLAAHEDVLGGLGHDLGGLAAGADQDALGRWPRW